MATPTNRITQAPNSVNKEALFQVERLIQKLRTRTVVTKKNYVLSKFHSQNVALTSRAITNHRLNNKNRNQLELMLLFLNQSAVTVTKYNLIQY